MKRNFRSTGQPIGQSNDKNNAASKQASATENGAGIGGDGAKLISASSPSDVNLELKNEINELDWKSEYAVNITNGMTINTADPHSHSQAYGDGRVNLGNNNINGNAPASNIENYNKSIVGEGGNLTYVIPDNEMLMFPTPPYRYTYVATSETNSYMKFGFNVMVYPVWMHYYDNQGHEDGRGQRYIAEINGRCCAYFVNEESLNTLSFILASPFAVPSGGGYTITDLVNASFAVEGSAVQNWTYTWEDSQHVIHTEDATRYIEAWSRDLNRQVYLVLDPGFERLIYNLGKFKFTQPIALIDSVLNGHAIHSFSIKGFISASTLDDIAEIVNPHLYGWGTTTDADWELGDI